VPPWKVGLHPSRHVVVSGRTRHAEGLRLSESSNESSARGKPLSVALNVLPHAGLTADRGNARGRLSEPFVVSVR